MCDLVFVNHRFDDRQAVFFRVRIEQRYVFLSAALTLQVDWQEVRAAGHQYPQYAPAISRVAHRCRKLRKDSRVNARISSTLARAERRIGFIHQHHYRRKCLKQVENLFEIRFARTDPALTKVLERNDVQAAIVREAFGQKRLACSDWTGDENAHRRFFGVACANGVCDRAHKGLRFGHPAN